MPAFRFCPSCSALLVDKLVQGEPRRVCSAGCGFVHYDNPTPVVAAIVEHEGRVVLARNRAWPRSFYGLITGFLEREETPEHCVVREVKEELNLDAGPPMLVGVYAFERMNQVIIAYHVLASGSVQLNAELAEYRMVKPERLKPWRAGTGMAVADWMRARGLPVEFVDRPIDPMAS